MQFEQVAETFETYFLTESTASGFRKLSPAQIKLYAERIKEGIPLTDANKVKLTFKAKGDPNKAMQQLLAFLASKDDKRGDVSFGDVGKVASTGMASYPDLAITPA